MLKEILAITGKPGLYKIVSNGKNMLVVEELTTGKRLPAHSRDKIVSLGDVAIYTEAEEMPLNEVLEKVRVYADNKPLDVKKLAEEGKLADTMAAVLPEYDRDHVYTSDMKKLFTWYNVLVGAGYDSFIKAEEEEEQTEEEKAAE